MKNKFFSALLCFIFMLSTFNCVPVVSFATTSDYSYTVLDYSTKTIEITKYTGSDKELDIPENIGKYTVVSLLSSAFTSDNNIQIINIPSTITNITGYLNLKNLEQINVDDNNETYSSYNGILYDKQQTTLIRCPYNYQMETVVVADNVKVIGSYAFSTKTSYSETFSTMLHITLPNSVEELQDYAFKSTRL